MLKFSIWQLYRYLWPEFLTKILQFDIFLSLLTISPQNITHVLQFLSSKLL